MKNISRRTFFKKAAMVAAVLGFAPKVLAEGKTVLPTAKSKPEAVKDELQELMEKLGRQAAKTHDEMIAKVLFKGKYAGNGKSTFIPYPKGISMQDIGRIRITPI